MRRLVSAIRQKRFELWLPGYARHLVRRAQTRLPGGLKHLVFALCDHYEPLVGQADEATGNERVRAWTEGYPRAFAGFRDADGRMPQHSWFFPGEEYRPQYLDGLAELVRGGAGEVELHLHHDGDTEASLRAKIEDYLRLYAQHGHFSRDPDGRVRYAFIHGNWALANGLPDGHWCGVDSELPLLFETGCYADMTFPSCPNATQSNMVNGLYWPTGDLRRRRSYDRGEWARIGQHYDDRILMVTGPLGLALHAKQRRPRLEYGALMANDPASASRVRSWVSEHIHVRGRPDWVFVKVYTHGAAEPQAASILGEGGQALHRALAELYNDGREWALHYVTARELFNIARAAMDSKQGDPNQYRDYVLGPPPVRG